MPGGTQQLGPRHHRIEDTKQDNPAGTADIAGVGTCRYSSPLSGRLLLAHRSYLALSGSVPRRPPCVPLLLGPRDPVSRLPIPGARLRSYPGSYTTVSGA